MHCLPKRSHHFRVGSFEQRFLLVGIPRGRSVGTDGLRKFVPTRIKPVVEHGDKTAKIVATASNQKSFRQRSVPITAILLAQEAQTGAPGENHFGRSFFDIQPASKLGRIHR